MSTIYNFRCLPGAGMRTPERAHVPQRRPVTAQRAPAGAPRLTADGGDFNDGPAKSSGARGDQPRDSGFPRVLHVDPDLAAAGMLASLLAPEAQVIHAATLAQARTLLETDVFSLVVLDPMLPDGDARVLLPLLSGTPLLLHAAHEPQWRDTRAQFLPKPWTTSRRLWGAVARLLGIPSMLCAGD